MKKDLEKKSVEELDRETAMEIASRLVNLEIDHALALCDRLAQSGEKNPYETWAVQRCDRLGAICVRPTYNRIFLGIQRFTKIASVCNLSALAETDRNERGEETIRLSIF